MTHEANDKMTDDIVRHHGLESFLHTKSSDGPGDGLNVAIHANCKHFNLRGNANDPKFIDCVEKTLQHTPPGEANTFTVDGGRRIYWLGPDEWLVVTEDPMPVSEDPKLESSTLR